MLYPWGKRIAQEKLSNAYLTLKTDIKKLQFGAKKCNKIHVGKICESYKCQDLKVDKWEEIVIQNDVTGTDDIDDECNGYEVMGKATEEKYLRDIVSSDGKNIKNIKARVAKGKGTISRIMSLLQGIPFGRFYFEVAMILRESLLVSSMLVNTEAWYNVTKPELELLETIDLQFLRNVLKAPKSTPKEMLYLETGCVPFRDIIRKRRILFLHYILNEKPSSILRKVLTKQIETKKPKDWISQVLIDIEELGMELNIENLKNMKKSNLKMMVNMAVKEKNRVLCHIPGAAYSRFAEFLYNLLQTFS